MITTPHTQNKTRTVASWNGDSPWVRIEAHFHPEDKIGIYIKNFEGYPLEAIETYAHNLLSAVAWLRAREAEHSESA